MWTTCSAVKKAALLRGEGGEKTEEGRRVRGGGKRRRGERRRKMSLTYRETLKSTSGYREKETRKKEKQ